jgi:uncharacterized membrane protein YeaQ/YmgE (transglycosylase-associated protein family)
LARRSHEKAERRDGQIFTNMAGAVGAYLGSFLAAQVMMPHSEEGAMGAQIGSSIGGLVGTWIMPGIGSFVGSFVGGLIGVTLDDLAGNDPEAALARGAQLRSSCQEDGSLRVSGPRKRR